MIILPSRISFGVLNRKDEINKLPAKKNNNK